MFKRPRIRYLSLDTGHIKENLPNCRNFFYFNLILNYILMEMLREKKLFSAADDYGA